MAGDWTSAHKATFWDGHGNAGETRNVHAREGDSIVTLRMTRGTVDPFMGSGTTALAAIQNDRDYVGFEIDGENYRDVIDVVDSEAQDHAADYAAGMREARRIVELELLADE